MSYKDYGLGVSQNPQSTTIGGAFSAEDRSYESLVIQENSPVIDWELNLNDEIKTDYGLRKNNQNLFPSHFLTNDFLESSDVLGSYNFLSATIGNENKFQLKAANAIINGWPLRIEYSNTSLTGLNEIELSAPPVGGIRTDLVILEVWRALVKAAPDIQNKSSTGLILRHGNTKAPDVVNLADDLIDPTYALESSARVQIQYRLRVINGVDLNAYPNGIEDPLVVANSVPDYGGPGVDGNPTVYTYSVTSHDKSVWIAGINDATGVADLGTIDGHIYAVPVCAVFRKNTAAFDRVSNINGGTSITSGVSTRPDSEFADQIAKSDIQDLRHGCPADLSEVLEKALSQLFQNSLTSNFEITGDNCGGTTVFCRDTITTTDSVRRSFSSRSITETIVAKVQFGGLPQNTFSIDLSSLTLAWAGAAINIVATGVSITDIKNIRVVSTTAPHDHDLISLGQVQSIIYQTPTLVDITLNISYASVIAYVELAITYSEGKGLSRNALRVWDLWVPPAASIGAWVDSSLFTATSDLTRFTLDSSLWSTEVGNREVTVQLRSIDQVATYYAATTTSVLIPERLTGAQISIDDGINPVYNTTNYTANTAYTAVTLNFAVPLNTPIQVTYKAFRPLPPVVAPPGDSYQVFYESASIQSLTPPAGAQTLNLIPRVVSKSLYSLSTSAASPELEPLAQASAQIPIGVVPSASYPESLLSGPQSLLEGMTIYAGIWTLGNLTPYAPNPQEVTLYKSGVDTVLDGDGRHFWPRSDNGVSDVYSPLVKGQKLAANQNHKVVLPTLMELKSDFPSIGKAGTLLLVLFSRLEPSSDNGIDLTNNTGRSSAAVFRVRGNMINSKRHG